MLTTEKIIHLPVWSTRMCREEIFEEAQKMAKGKHIFYLHPFWKSCTFAVLPPETKGWKRIDIPRREVSIFHQLLLANLAKEQKKEGRGIFQLGEIIYSLEEGWDIVFLAPPYIDPIKYMNEKFPPPSGGELTFREKVLTPPKHLLDRWIEQVCQKEGRETKYWRDYARVIRGVTRKALVWAAYQMLRQGKQVLVENFVKFYDPWGDYHAYHLVGSPELRGLSRIYYDTPLERIFYPEREVVKVDVYF